jgi:formylglycine-generating enzyme required for sulfatase activity
LLGTTPLEDVRVSLGFKQYRITKAGFDELTGFTGTDQKGRGRIGLKRTLPVAGTIPSDMVLVEGGGFNPASDGSTSSTYQPTIISGMPAVDLGQFLIDRTEVTNKQYQAFVDAGGYQDKKYWKHEFIRDGKKLEWDSAIAEFKDGTGRAGPAAWELSSYPRGQDDHPVGGISWYEAAAYAEFAGKELPTVYHWNKAAGLEMDNTHPLILNSNFENSGAVAVATFQGVSPFGALDMVGNVREWCWNPAGDGRAAVGGSWGVPQYLATWVERQPAFDRSERNGFRCIRPLAGIGIPELARVSTPETSPVVDLSRVRPIPDEVFNAYQNAYAYDKADLEPGIEATEDLWGHCTRQRVSFKAAYGGERVTAYLYLPKKGKAPFQTVIYFPGSAALSLNSIDRYNTKSVEIFTRAGRAVVFPVYKGTFQRPRVDDSTPTLRRDWYVMLFKDLGRTIDYLETRSEFDASKLAYYGTTTTAWTGR